MTVWFKTDSWGKTPALLLVCPTCGFEYQKHGTVREFVRPKEDGPSEEVSNGRTVPTEDNPSPRRGAVVVDVEGECGHHWQLQIIQHKGQTFCTAREMGDGQVLEVL